MPRYPQRTRRRGSWRLDSDLPQGATAEDHVTHLLDRLGEHGSEIRNIVCSDGVGEVYVSCFLSAGTGTVLLSPDTLGRVAALGLTLLIALYDEGTSDDDVPEPDAPLDANETAG